MITTRTPRLEHRRWGYLVWVIGAAVIAIPEMLAAMWSHSLPFTTISGMTGHLERHHNWVELVVIVVVVFVIFSTVRVRPVPEGVAPSSESPGRTPGGRLTIKAAPATVSATGADSPAPVSYDDENDAPRLFLVSAAISAALIAVATYCATVYWDDPPRHYQPAYVLYGTLALVWLVIPSLIAFGSGKDPPYPTLFRTITNLEDFVRSRTWQINGSLLGPPLAWLVSFVILWGLIVLLLHLTLYPFPNITHIINPNG